MGCVSCAFKKLQGSGLVSYPKKVREVVSCDLTEEDITELRDSLFCLKAKIPFREFNKYLGTINSLLAVRDFCRYDISKIKKTLKEYGCT